MARTIAEIAEALVSACRAGRTQPMVKEYYAETAESVEAMAMPGTERITSGREAILGKQDWWEENFEMHGGTVDGPYLHGEDRFGVIFEVDATNKATGERNQMKELAIYHVSDGKIVREEFFYAQPPA